MMRRALVAALAVPLILACAPARELATHALETALLPLGAQTAALCRIFRPSSSHAFHAVILFEAHSCYEPPEVDQHWYEVGQKCERLIRAHGRAANAEWWPRCEEWLAR